MLNEYEDKYAEITVLQDNNKQDDIQSLPLAIIRDLQSS